MRGGFSQPTIAGQNRRDGWMFHVKRSARAR
jgi:hypothetical protein